MPGKRARWTVVIGLAAAFGAAGAWRARHLGPGLTFAVERLPAERGVVPYRLTATPRGGETLDEVAFVVPGDWVEIHGPTGARRLRHGTDLVTTIRVDASSGPASVAVRLRAGDRPERTYELNLAERAP